MLIEVDFDINTHIPIYCDGRLIYTLCKKGEFWCLGLYNVSKSKFVMNDCIKFFRQYKIRRLDVNNSLLCVIGQRENKNYIIIYDLDSLAVKIMHADHYLDFFVNSDYCLYINNSTCVSLMTKDFYRNSSHIIMFDLISDTAKEYNIPFLVKYYRNLSFCIMHCYCNDMQDGVSDKIWTSYFEPQLSLPEKVIIADYNNFDDSIELFSSDNEQSVEITAIDETDIYYSIIDIKKSIGLLSESGNKGWLNNYCGQMFKYNFETKSVSKLPYDINRVFSSVDGKKAYFYESSNIVTDISNGNKICMTKDITDINNSFVLLSDYKYFDMESGESVSSFEPFAIQGNYMIIQSCGK